MQAVPEKLLLQVRERLRSSSGPLFWRSLEEAAAAPEFQQRLKAEFPAGASLWNGGAAGRRQFLKLMGASLALAGMSGCVRPPSRKIAPYVRQPEGVPGQSVYYATAMPWYSHGRGVLVEAHEGRPIKIEGNPDHPASLGATDAATQASILELYHPDRLQAPMQQATPTSWRIVERELLAILAKAEPAQGRGLGILVEPCTSPTWKRQLRQLAGRFPRLRVFSHSSFYTAADLAAVSPVFELERADVVVSLGADLFEGSPGSVRYSRDFAGRRRSGLSSGNMNRLLVAESEHSLTGAMADLRAAVSPPEIVESARRLNGGPRPQRAGARQWLETVQGELSGDKKVLLVVGAHQAPEAHLAAIDFNEKWAGDSVRYIQNPLCGPEDAEDLQALVDAAMGDELEALLIFSDNPVYSAPADIPLAQALESIPWTAHLTLFRNETSTACRWALPKAHYLETWSDIRAFDGTATIQQPLIAPLYRGRSRHELLAFLNGAYRNDPMQLVQQTYREGRKEDFDAFWRQSLHDGVVAEEVSFDENSRRYANALQRLPTRANTGGTGLHVIFRPDPSVGDGRWAGNPWLQELPKSMSMLVWENAALLAPELADKLGLGNGDVVRLELAGRSVEAPVWMLPGQDPATVLLHLGYGQKRPEDEAPSGFNANTLRSADSPWCAQGLKIQATGRRHELVTTQEHHSMHGRHLAIEGDLAQFRKNAGFVHDLVHTPKEDETLYPSFRRGAYAWAMAIDLGVCTGCRACVIACQAENNIPVVGKQQVAMGREMHWLRVDRYHSGDPANPRTIHQPVPCMHCEKAPCEVVCPVAATTHSNSGINEMTYNRCVGTRYCSNNCPYKVRRFNFLDYHGSAGAPQALQHNPHVTVRMTGVMEKCTYCIQRINDARGNAKTERRRIRDGEVKTACQQACPTEAIHFGDLNDADSIVSQLKRSPLNYALLAELNTRPRTTYLARIRNTPGNTEEEAG